MRRISPRGIITTIARIREVAGLAVHPEGGSLALASIDGYVRRLDLATGRLELLAGNGTQASGGDGGPAAQAQLNRPHDVAYDARGTCSSRRQPASVESTLPRASSTQH